MGEVVPSLSSSGWITELAERADRTMAYYLTSDHSQSELYAGRVVSLQYHIEQFGHSHSLLQQQVNQDLERYFGRYFDRIDLTVSVNGPGENNEDRTELRIECIITEGNQRYSLGKLITTIDSKVIGIFDLNNG